MHILLLENTPDMALMLRQALEMEGHEVTVGYNGRQGLDLLAQFTPHLILSDLKMPEFDGFEFLDYIRSSPQWAHLPFIAVSGNLAEAQRAVEAGANDYLSKPFHLDTLRAKLDKWLPHEN
ncbi:MAG: response regulator [Chloroflexi bacterium]|nr:response regulator [Chloroflexota bacterium]